MASTVMSRLNRFWTSSSIRFLNKYRLYKSLVVSILLYSLRPGCFTPTQNAGYRHLNI
ncbi:hypothetical protein DPMN_153253 [Dreissena polymorpha]|uniref:Uncharacterized protein n=1 Tax=Dreissena polymorpha TaxID=45954 RepID=A0A9D4J971_DREPO|nr:hypothetical protein DPMN_153253 [Dreissena polymorpha]